MFFFFPRILFNNTWKHGYSRHSHYMYIYICIPFIPFKSKYNIYIYTYLIITCFAAYIIVEQWCQKSKSKIFRYRFWYIQYQVHIFNIMKYIYISIHGLVVSCFFLQVLSTVHRGLACHSSKKRPQCRRPPTPFGAFGALRGARLWESKRLAVDPVVSLGDDKVVTHLWRNYQELESWSYMNQLYNL